MAAQAAPPAATLPLQTLTLSRHSPFSPSSLYVDLDLILTTACAGTTTPPVSTITHRTYGPDEPRKGAYVLVEALEREGVTDVFAYPGVAMQLMEDMGIRQKLDFSAWREELNQQKKKFPLNYKTHVEFIPPQYAIQVLDMLTNGEAIISTGVGQHQMWAAQYYTYRRPRQFLSSGGLGAMGFGLPAAAGAAVANPGVTVVDIDGDGSFQMNVQE